MKHIWAHHETFHPRYGWLKKGFDLVKKYPDLFRREDAPVLLGVGKNMVKAIRYWCQAFQVLKKDDTPSEFGNLLLSDSGYDPYLENPASLWLLHWYLLKSPWEAAAWYYTFNYFRGGEFCPEDLLEDLRAYQRTLEKVSAESSLKKDVNCLLRMYSQNRNQSGLIEDSLDCPFSELGLIYQSGESKRYLLQPGAKVNLPSAIIVVACLEFAKAQTTTQTLPLARLLYDVGSPGMVFKLTEESLCTAIEKIARENGSITLADTAGLVQFSWQENPETIAQGVLDKYFRC